MPPEDRDPKYLWDMLDASRLVMSMTSGTTFEQYQQNRMLQLAVERAIEIVGEAARNISNSFCTAHPEIPWRPIIAQRHILAHEYGEIKTDRIWRVVTIHIPELVRLIEPLIPAPPT